MHCAPKWGLSSSLLDGRVNKAAKLKGPTFPWSCLFLGCLSRPVLRPLVSPGDFFVPASCRGLVRVGKCQSLRSAGKRPRHHGTRAAERPWDGSSG